MCEPVPSSELRLSRRRFLAAAPIGLVAAGVLAGPAAVPAAAGVSVVPRSEWGPGLTPIGPVPDEPDVRLLLVHHSVNANTYAQSAVQGMLTGIFNFHTGSKGWPDIAYNFFVDRFGGVWEGRLGSLNGAKAADATGGSQGFAQLCCFLGDHSTEPPSAAAQTSMGALLGWLADRHGVDLGDGARAQFTSRGSNRFPAGAAVDVPTMSGHRDVSQTACPGNAAYALVTDGTFRRLARGGGEAVPAPVATTTTKPAAAAAATTTTAAATTTTASTTTTSTTMLATTSTTVRRRTEAAAAEVTRSGGGGSARWGQATAGAAIMAAVAGGLVALRSRGARRQP